MKRISLLFTIFVICFATLTQAQTAAPKPDPEIQKMSMFAGHWKYEGEVKPTPVGPLAPGKYKSEWFGEMTLGGFFFERRVKGSGPGFDYERLDVYWYDPAIKSLTYADYLNNGHVDSGVFEVTGNVYTVRWKETAGGKDYQMRATYTLARDGLSMDYKMDYSPDGQTWTTSGEGKAVKFEPAANK